MKFLSEDKLIVDQEDHFIHLFWYFGCFEEGCVYYQLSSFQVSIIFL